ncbi:MAG: hypothetical protein KAH22_01655 [Thiotrichaceae bacterium]|nr:hypothetical protein [Thiotrichaceae bacterium]
MRGLYEFLKRRPRSFPSELKLVILLVLSFIGTILIFDKPLTQSSIPISYYYWQQSYEVSPLVLKKYAPHRLYIKFLDLAYRNNQLIINKTKFKQEITVNYIPVIYLSNMALKQSKESKIMSLINQAVNRVQHQKIQIDCDWSDSTKDKYFQLLEKLGKQYAEVSVTIRLHQVKFFERTGVPPVTKGVLMYYNMSDIYDPATQNYILDNSMAKRYLVNFKRYPLALDLALPLYQQVRVIRQGRWAYMSRGISPLNLKKLTKISMSRYHVNKGHYYQGQYLYPDDILVLDKINIKQLKIAIKNLTNFIQPNEITFYDLPSAQRFKPVELKQLVSELR